MTDFISKKDKNNGVLKKIKNFLVPKNNNQITLLSEADFDSSMDDRNSKKNSHSNNDKTFLTSLDVMSVEHKGLDEKEEVEEKKESKMTYLKKTSKIKKERETLVSPSTMSMTLHSGNIETYKKKLFLIGNLPARTQYLFGVFLTFIGFFGLLISYFLSTSNQYNYNILQNNITTLVAELQILSNTLNSNNLEDSTINDLMKSQIVSLDRRVSNIWSTGDGLGINNSDIIKSMNINKNWQITNESLKSLGVGVKSYDAKNFNDIISYLNGMTNGLSNYRVNPDVLLLLNNLEKMKIDLNSLYNTNDIQLITNIKQNEEIIRNNLINVRWNKPSGIKVDISVYEKVGLMWIGINPVLNDFINYSINVGNSKKNLTTVADNISAMTTQINQGLLKYPYMENTEKVRINMIFVVSICLIILSIVLVIYVYLYEQDNDALLDKLENQHNQQSIMKILDEMGPFSEGNLTKQITVNEDLTSAISDAINSMINDFKVVVMKIRDASEKVEEKTKEVQKISLIISENGEEQVNQINNTASEVLELTDLIDKISHKTHKGENVANQALKSSEYGTESVKESIHAMNSIKLNMGETIRLMKRLDDFSSQISKIMDLLADITDETRVLGENATVQASKAGEAGKGFKIVADAVTSLSSKATDATIKVSALINATKTDIQEIVSAMDKTNMEIERGTQLSEKAGVVLDEIKEVSIELTGIIKDISKDTQQHVNKANDISIEIKNIEQLAGNSQESNTKIVESINNMKEISSNLNKEVKHFTVD